METFGLVLLFAAMPAAGNFMGGALAEVLPLSRRGLSLSLHAAAGVVMAVVGLELMPEALAPGGATAWLALVAFVAGGGCFILLERLIGTVRRRAGADAQGAAPWAIFAGVSMDLLADGVMIGTGTVVDPALGLLLAVGQVPADVPEGFATIATFRSHGVPRARRLLFAAAFAVPVFVGASAGYWLLRDMPEAVTLAVLALTGGLLTALMFEEIMEEAHEHRDAVYAPMLLVGGFATFAAVSTFVG